MDTPTKLSAVGSTRARPGMALLVLALLLVPAAPVAADHHSPDAAHKGLPQPDGAPSVNATALTVPEELGVPTMAPIRSVGGRTSAVVVAGNFVYVGHGTELLVLERSRSAQPSVLGRLAGLGSTVNDIAVTGTTVYLALGRGGLAVVDAADPRMPRWVAHLTTSDRAEAVTVTGRYGYIADGAAGLLVFDAADPAHVTAVGYMYLLRGYASDVEVVGGTAFVADGSLGGLVLADVSNPVDPRFLRDVATPDKCLGLAVRLPYVYIADGDGFVVYDVADRKNPRRAGLLALPGGNAIDVVLAGDSAYVADGGRGLQVVDVRDPMALAAVLRATTGRFARDLALDGERVLVADENLGLMQMDLAGFRPLREAGHLVAPDEVLFGVAVDGSYAYVGGSGLGVADLADPTAPRMVSWMATADDVYTLRVRGNRAYLALGYGGLAIADISNPEHPRTLGALAADWGVWAVDTDGSHAYLAEDEDGLQVVDVSDPSSPRRLGGVATTDFVNDVVLAGNHVYLAENNAGLTVVDVVDPTRPRTVGRLGLPGTAIGVYVVGQTAYVADGFAGLRIVDVRDPAAPHELGSYSGAGSAFAVFADTQRAFVADDEGHGLWVVDVRDPTAPREIGTIAGRWEAWSVCAVGERAFVATATGLHVVDSSGAQAVVRHLAYDGLPGSAINVTVDGRTAYVASDGGLALVDVENPLSPRVQGGVDLPGTASGVAVQGSWAYVAGGYTGLWLVDVSVPSQPQAVAHVGVRALEVTRSGAYLFVAGGPRLTVVDVGDPRAPSVVAQIETKSALDVAVAGSSLYVAGGSEGLLVFDVSDPTYPWNVRRIATVGTAHAVEVVTPYVYVADSSMGGGLWVLYMADLSIPAPVKIDLGPAYGVEVAGNLAFVALGERGVRLLDVADPLRPQLVAVATTLEAAESVAVLADQFLVADRLGGLLVCNMPAAGGWSRVWLPRLLKQP